MYILGNIGGKHIIFKTEEEIDVIDLLPERKDEYEDKGHIDLKIDDMVIPIDYQVLHNFDERVKYYSDERGLDLDEIDDYKLVHGEDGELVKSYIDDATPEWDAEKLEDALAILLFNDPIYIVSLSYWDEINDDDTEDHFIFPDADEKYETKFDK